MNHVEKGTNLDANLINGIIDTANGLYYPSNNFFKTPNGLVFPDLLLYSSTYDGYNPQLLDIKQSYGYKITDRKKGTFLSSVVVKYFWMYVGKDTDTFKNAFKLDNLKPEHILFSNSEYTDIDCELSDKIIQNFSTKYYTGWVNTGINTDTLRYAYVVGRYSDGSKALSAISTDFSLVFTDTLVQLSDENGNVTSDPLSARVASILDKEYDSFFICKSGNLQDIGPNRELPGQYTSSGNDPKLSAYPIYKDLRQFDFRTSDWQPWQYVARFGGFINPVYQLGSKQLTCDSIALSSYKDNALSDLSTLGQLGINYVPALSGTNWLVVDIDSISAFMTNEISAISAEYQVPIKIASVLSSGEVNYFTRNPVIPCWEQFDR